MKALHFTNLAQAKDYMQSNENLGIVLFGNVSKVKELSQNASPNVVLCSTAGEYTKEGFKEDGICGFSYEREMAEIIEIQSPAIVSVDQLKEAYQKVQHNKQAFMLLLCDGLSGQEESIMTTLFFMKDDFKVVGGSAGDYLKFEETYIYIGKKKVSAAALFFDCKQRTQLVKENIYQSTGKSLLVTEAEPVKRIVKTFNNRPAATEYASVLGVTEETLADSFMNHPLGKVMKNSTYISSPMQILSDKSIQFYSQILPNTFVDILETKELNSCFENTIHSFAFKPSFLFSVHCILRSLKFKEEKIWAGFDQKFLKDCDNQAGFISYGEQIYKKHVNQTMVVLAVE